MQTHHYCAYLREAACLLKLGRKEEAKAKAERAKYIVTHAWAKKDGSANYFDEKTAYYFRKYYREAGLEEIEPCPL